MPLVTPTPAALLPTPPTTADPASFDVRADATLLAQQAMVPQMNQLAADAFTNASFAQEQAVAAQASANAAANQVGLAAHQVDLAADQAILAATQVGLAADQVALAQAAAQAAAAGPNTVATSATAAAIGLGARTFTVATGKSFVPGQFVTVASVANPANYLFGQVTSYTSGTGALVVNATQSNGSGTFSDWSISLAPPGSSNPDIKTPANISPSAGATVTLRTPTLVASEYLSLYGVPMSAAQWQVSTVADFATTVVNTGDLAGTATSYTVPTGIVVSTTYFWRVRYKDASGSYSSWSTATSFVTAATLSDFIPTPAATPASFGDALEGGFYAGMVWGELTQSTTSTTIGVGARTFTVPSMVGAAVVYNGQSVEVRSRANPANRMQGTVTAASGTSLSISVATVTGSGTFADWSIMARHRIIVAPKSTEVDRAYKNPATAAPAACITLTEGRRATLAMVAADTAAVYPAAHYCNGLTTSGRTDWYLPARDELELCWRNLKPTTDANITTADRLTAATSYQTLGSFGDTAATHGTNNNSAPAGAAYTSGVPGRVANPAFHTGGAEAFEYSGTNYTASTEYDATQNWGQFWGSSVNTGRQGPLPKNSAFRVRAVRRSVI